MDGGEQGLIEPACVKRGCGRVASQAQPDRCRWLGGGVKRGEQFPAVLLRENLAWHPRRRQRGENGWHGVIRPQPEEQHGLSSRAQLKAQRRVAKSEIKSKRAQAKDITCCGRTPLHPPPPST